MRSLPPGWATLLRSQHEWPRRRRRCHADVGGDRRGADRHVRRRQAALGRRSGPHPRDANLALATRLDAARVLDVAIEIAGKIEPQAPKEFNANLKELEEHLGVDLRQDVLAALGNVWCVYNSPDEGGLILTGLTGVVRVKDYERLSAAHAKLLAAAKAALAQPGGPPLRKPARAATPGKKTAEELEIEEENAPQNRPQYGFRQRPQPRIGKSASPSRTFTSSRAATAFRSPPPGV